MYAHLVSKEGREGIWSSGTRVIDDCEPARACWESNLSHCNKSSKPLSHLSNTKVFLFFLLVFQTVILT